MLSAPADAMLSSGLFAAFTHEVAARIIQHYWREHVSRRLTAEDCSKASANPQQGPAHLAEPEADPKDGEAHVPDQTDEEESLADAMMRYRWADDTKAAASRNSQQQVNSSSLAIKRGLLETSTTASAASLSCRGDVSFEVAQASMSSLDKLKQRQGKQRRHERPMAQRAKHALLADAELLPDSTQQDRSAAVASCLPAAESPQHAQQAPCYKAQDSSCPAQSAGPQLVTDSSRGLQQESSDTALLQMLNPRLHVHSKPPPVKPPRVSTDSMPLQQQQQEAHGTWPVRGAAEPQAGSGENVSPNLSPDNIHAKRLHIQTKQAKVPAAAASGFVHQEPNPPEMGSDHRGYKAADATATPVAMHSSSQRQESDRLSSNKLADIFAFLDGVEAQAEAEAAAVVQSHAVHKPSLHGLAAATSASVHASSATLHHSPVTTDGHQQHSHQQHRHQQHSHLQHQLGLSHLQQKVNKPEGSSVSQRSHEAAGSSSANVPTGSQVTGADHKLKTSVVTSRTQTSAAHEQTGSTKACTAETGSAGQLLAATSAFLYCDLHTSTSEEQVRHIHFGVIALFALFCYFLCP